MELFHNVLLISCHLRHFNYISKGFLSNIIISDFDTKNSVSELKTDITREVGGARIAIKFPISGVNLELIWIVPFKSS